MYRYLLAFLFTAAPAMAEPPRVIADIAPVHSLVAQVMGDLGTPDLLLDPDIDPHHFQTRPSHMRILTQADLVVWMGEAMTPWLEGTLENITDAHSLELLEIDPLPMRIDGSVAETLNAAQMATREEDPQGAEEHAHSGHDHGHGHGEDGIDPHAWLDPVNAAEFLLAIAEELSELDPENAATYQANAEAGAQALLDLTDQLTKQLAASKGVSLIPYHNAYRYFFIRFNLRVSASISQVDGVPPSAAQLSDVQRAVQTSDQVCLFSEPGANEKLLQAVAPDPDATFAVLDPLNAYEPLGPDYYATLLQNMADIIQTCTES